MKTSTTTLLACFSIFRTHAFTPLSTSSQRHHQGSVVLSRQQRPSIAASPLFVTTTLLKNKSDDAEVEIERLRQMAAKLRTEAAVLEAEQSQAMADAAERVFNKFDTNQDGEITLEELKAGLESSFKTELSEKRVEQLMKDFDKSEDGKLQRDEFVTLEIFRSVLRRR